MKKFLFLLPLLLACTCCFAQLTGLEGRWLGDEEAFMLIADSSKPDPDFTGSFISTTSYSVGRGTRGIYEVLCKGDMLSFLAWDDQLQPLKPYDLRIINQTDTTLVLLPASEPSIALFSGKDTLRFRRQKRVLDPNFKFEKIVFRIEPSYGPSGMYHFQLDSTRWVKLYASDYFMQPDTAHEGYFAGQVSDSLYKELQLAIQDANLEKLKMSEEMCCDGAISTLIIYYNGKRKFFETMHSPPAMAVGLFNILYEIRGHRSLFKTTEKFELEH